jgi:hypothetical protein
LESGLILQPLRLEGKRHLESSILLVVVVVLGLPGGEAIEHDDDKEAAGFFLIVLVVAALLGLPVVGKSRSQSGTLAYIKGCMDCYPF